MLKPLCIAITLLVAQFGDVRQKSIDRRSASDESRYFLVFCARGGTEETRSLTGHAFVVVGKEDAKTKTCTQRAFGLYPASSGGVLRTVPGKVVDESLSGALAATTHRLIVEVSRDQYYAAEATRQRWAAQGEYKLIEHDCVSFTMEVAKAARLTTPDRAGLDNLPQRYILALMDQNN